MLEGALLSVNFSSLLQDLWDLCSALHALFETVLGLVPGPGGLCFSILLGLSERMWNNDGTHCSNSQKYDPSFVMKLLDENVTYTSQSKTKMFLYMKI